MIIKAILRGREGEVEIPMLANTGSDFAIITKEIVD